eukprot:TRINITY_DN12427_c0_g1_i1.p1 TRINITY_DN12427_c0_g1~~TRINITY_DN12427_c0_g1_i1.p1  ORF type:complete len:319 (-),score=67.03 TRINITY_DN12427_c0_g1_i1:105-1061(-)
MAENNLVTQFGEQLHTSQKEIINQEDQNFKGEREFAVEKLDNFGIMMFGPPRVGKSTLINAITGKTLAPTSASLDSCTKEVKAYQLNVNVKTDENKEISKTITFFDTPGVEDWEPKTFGKLVDEYLKKCNPICSLIVVSPGGFAVTENLDMVIQHLIENKIFVCLIVSNIHAGTSEQVKEIWNFYVKMASKHFGTILNDKCSKLLDVYELGLICGLNSTTFTKENPFNDKVEKYEPQNVNQLIYGMMSGLSHDKLYGWCLTILENRNFLQKFGHKIKGLWEETLVPGILNFKESVQNGLKEYKESLNNGLKIIYTYFK